jgi:hypothetical protein
MDYQWYCCGLWFVLPFLPTIGYVVGTQDWVPRPYTLDAMLAVMALDRNVNIIMLVIKTTRVRASVPIGTKLQLV